MLTLAAWVYTPSNNFRYNSEKHVLFEKYLKSDCLTQQEQQISMKYFLYHTFLSR